MSGKEVGGITCPDVLCSSFGEAVFVNVTGVVKTDTMKSKTDHSFDTDVDAVNAVGFAACKIVPLWDKKGKSLVVGPFQDIYTPFFKANVIDLRRCAGLKSVKDS